MKKDIKEIEITNLFLDPENARYGNSTVESQRAAIDKMFQLENGKAAGKIINLADHIASHGMDPSELPIVIPVTNEVDESDDHIERYYVIEGNRRLLALKLLHNPDLAPSEGYRQKLGNITSAVIRKQLETIQVSVLPDRESSNMWVDLKHTGQNEGVGRVGWDGIATDAFRARAGKPKSIGRQVLEFIEADADFDDELKEKAKKLSVTNLTRFFGGKPAKDALGLVEKGRLLESTVSLDDLRRAIEYTIGLMSQPGFRVSDIYHKGDQEKFIAKQIPKEIIPDKNEKVDSWSLSAFDATRLSREQKGEPRKKEEKKTVRSKPSSASRYRLIDFTLKVDDKRIRDIYIELKSKIHVQETPNAAAVLFRVLLELTCDYVVENYNVVRKDNGKLLGESDSLGKKVEHISYYLKDEGKLTERQASLVRKLSSQNNEAFSVDSMHKYVHAYEYTPIPSELNRTMDNWAPFFKAIWK